MRIVRETPDTLVLLHRPVLLSAALALGTLLLLAVSLWNLSTGEWVKGGAGLLATIVVLLPAIWFGVERVDVVFDAVEGTCSINTRRLSGPAQATYKLSQVERAMVETHSGPSDAGGAHRVALVLHPGRAEDRRALTTGYASGRGASDITDRINTWLEARRAG